MSIVVPNWNGSDHLPQLFAALDLQTFRDFEICVVDNGSTDGSREWLEGRSDVHLVALTSNSGFAAAVNRGVAESRADLILLLNNDMEPLAGFLAALMAAAVHHADAGSFASKVLSRSDAQIIDSAGDRLARSGRATGIGRGAHDGPEYDIPRWVFGATGGAVLFRRSVLEAVGGFDADFFLYVEDTDVAFRAQLLGWRCRYVPAAVTLHVGSASTRGRSEVRAHYCLRNYICFLLKVYPAAWWWRFRWEIIRQIGREITFSFSASRARYGGVRALGAILRTFGEIVWRVPRMLVRRWRVVRTVSLQAVEREVFG